MRSEREWADSDRGLNRSSIVRLARLLVDDLVERQFLAYPSGAFLGLAAGAALAELELAREFGISDITLVDDRTEPGVEANYLKDDIFQFVESWSGDTFGMVSVFGIEYVLEDKHNWERLWNGLKRVTHRGSLVVLYPNILLQNIPRGVRFKVLYHATVLIALRE